MLTFIVGETLKLRFTIRYTKLTIRDYRIKMLPIMLLMMHKRGQREEDNGEREEDNGEREKSEEDNGEREEDNGEREEDNGECEKSEEDNGEREEDNGECEDQEGEPNEPPTPNEGAVSALSNEVPKN